MKIKFDIGLTQFTEPLLKNIDRCRLQITTDSNKADLFVKFAHEITSQDLTSGRSFIALEKEDGARIAKVPVLKSPAVVRYVKQYKYSNNSLNNDPCVDRRWFTRYLTSPEEYTESPYIVTPEDHNKVVLGWNFLHYGRMRKFITPQKTDDNRSIDVFFAGSIHYASDKGTAGRLISEHRRKCVFILKSMKNINAYVLEGRPLKIDDYLKALRSSKVVVSPWGWGEVCYRDYEAVLAECVLVKPDTSYVESSCGLFKRDNNLWVMPGLTDLEAKVRQALQNFIETKAHRIQKRKEIISESERIQLIIENVFKF